MITNAPSPQRSVFPRSIRIVAVLLGHLCMTLFVLCRIVQAQPSQTPELQKVGDLASLQLRVQTLYEKIAPCIVLDECKAPVASRSGVIVTAEGHVLSVASPSPGRPRVFRLADGRRVSATTLGWCEEWGFGLSKITENGPWPHVALGTTGDLIAGQLCVALGYVRRADGKYDIPPALRLGNITRLDAPNWLTTSCVCGSFEFGKAVFDLEGQLVGVTTRITARGSIEIASDLVKTYWDDLAAGRNLDWVRYPPARGSVFYQLGSAKELDRLGLVRAEGIFEEGSAPIGGKTPSQVAEHHAKGIEKATASTVRICQNKQDGVPKRWSGVIVSSDGFIMTCGHSNVLPGEKVTVYLSDGRDTPGVVLGTNWVSDVGLVKITKEGLWPRAEMHNSAMMRPAAPAIIVGYPANRPDGKPSYERQPLVQTAEIARNPYVLWNHQIFTTLNYQLWGGTSGGGVFDSEGRVVAVHSGGGNTRVEVVRCQWDYLAAGKPVDVMSSEPLGQIRDAFTSLAKETLPKVVEILGDGTQRALGTIVDRDGEILTKASELYGTLSCRLADGRILPATVAKLSREHDLALLKVDADGLPIADFIATEDIGLGKLVAAAIPGQAPLVGVVSLTTRPIPPEPRWLGEGLQDTDRGLSVCRLPRFRGLDVPIRNGDVIVHVEDHPTPDLETFVRLMKSQMAVPDAFPGDPMRVGAKRGEKKLEFCFPLLPAVQQPYVDMYFSPRRSGFPNAFDTNIPLNRNLCGGPVIDRTGRVVGIVIAVRGALHERRGPTHVVPAVVAKDFVAD